MKTSLTPMHMLAPMLLCAALAPGLAAQNTTESAAPDQTGAEFRTLIESARTFRLAKDKPSTSRAVFGDPHKPGTLKINDAISHVEIQGVTGHEVTVSSPLPLKNPSQTDEEGFRRLDAITCFELVEKDNVISLNVTQGSDNMAFKHDFKIQVPRDTNIIIETASSQYRRYVTITGIDGDVDINIGGGDIILKNTTGAITANTTYSSITAEPGQAPRKPIMLANMGDAITLVLPAAAAANLRMSTRFGSVRTNFSETALKRAAETDTAFQSQGTAEERLNKLYDEHMKAIDEESAMRRQARATTATSGTASLDGQVSSEAASKRIAAIRAEIAKRQQQRDSLGLKSATATPSTGGKVITAELNGGGVDIRLTTIGGVITLQQAK